MLSHRRPLTRFVIIAQALALAAGAMEEREAQPLITPAPTVPQLLEKRNIVTWAYVSGDSNSPLTCPEGFTTTQEFSGFGLQSCCNSLSCVNDYQTCISYGESVCMDDLPCSDLFTSYLSCGEQSPGCVTYRSINGPADAGGLTSYNCGPSATELLALGSPAAGAAVSTLAVSASVVGVGFGPGGVATTIVPSIDTVSSLSSASSNIQTSSPLSSYFVSQTTTGIRSSSLLSTGLSDSSTTANSLPSATSSSSGGGNGNNSSSGLGTGDIIGIVTGVVTVVGIFIAIYVKWPKTITRCLTCGICTTVDDDNQPAYHGVPLRYIPQHYDAPNYQPYNQPHNPNYIR